MNYRSFFAFLATIMLGASTQGPLWGDEAKPAESISRAANPMLADIARANDAAWDAIKSIDMEYSTTIRVLGDGKTIFEQESTARWTKAGQLERMRRHPSVIKVTSVHTGGKANDAFEDLLLDGKSLWQFTDANPKTKDKGELFASNQKGLSASLRPAPSEPWTRQDMRPGLLRYLQWSIIGSNNRFTREEPVTLSEMLHSPAWKVTLRGQKVTNDGDILWLIHAEYPPVPGSYVDLEVNGSKNYLIQAADFHISLGKDKTLQNFRYTERVEFDRCAGGVYFPKRAEYHLLAPNASADSKDGTYVTVVASKLLVNVPLPADALELRLPENLIVRKESKDGRPEKYLIWGPDNKPVKELAPGEMDGFVEKEGVRQLAEQVAKNRSSKKPADLRDRAMYGIVTEDYDAAIASCSELLASQGNEADAYFIRGLAYLLYKQDYAVKAIEDFTSCLKCQPDEGNAAACHYLRGLAYASQKDGIEKAVEDMVESLRLDPCCREMIVGARLVLSISQLRKGNLADALDNASKAVALDAPSTNADAYAVRAHVYETMGDHEKAAADRAASARWRSKPLGDNKMEAAFAKALHRCLTQLVSGMK